MLYMRRIVSGKHRRCILLAVLVSTLVLSFSGWTGYRGIDFGYHWDEDLLLFDAAHLLRTGSYKANWAYNWPSLMRHLACLTLLPELAEHMLLGKPDTEELIRVVKSHPFKLRARAVFLSLTLLAGVWTFLLVWFWRKEAWVAAFSSSLLLTSWEIGYHARWITGDALMMHFGILTMLLLLLARRSAERAHFWLLLAAISAGLTCSSKWTGGIILLPVIMACVFLLWRKEGRLIQNIPRLVLASLSAVLVFALVVAIVTPGWFLEPERVYRDILRQAFIYGERGHGGYSTQGVLDHGSLIAKYIGTVMLSPYKALAMFFAGMAVLGGFRLLRNDLPEGLVFLFVPVVFPFYMATQKVMIVRNLLVLGPFLAVLSGIGVWQIQGLLAKYRWPRILFAAACVVMLGFNGSWAWYASESIVLRYQRPFLEEVVAFQQKHEGRKLVFSPALARDLSKRFPEKSFSTPCRRKAGDKADLWCAFYSSDILDMFVLQSWPANRLHYTLLPSGPYEVNWDYYPTWRGDRRIVLLPLRVMMKTPLKMYVSGSRAPRRNP